MPINHQGDLYRLKTSFKCRKEAGTIANATVIGEAEETVIEIGRETATETGIMIESTTGPAAILTAPAANPVAILNATLVIVSGEMKEALLPPDHKLEEIKVETREVVGRLELDKALCLVVLVGLEGDKRTINDD